MNLSANRLTKIAHALCWPVTAPLRQYSLSDPRVAMVQIPKERYLCVQATGLIILRPESKKGAHYL